MCEVMATNIDELWMIVSGFVSFNCNFGRYQKINFKDKNLLSISM